LKRLDHVAKISLVHDSMLPANRPIQSSVQQLAGEILFVILVPDGRSLTRMNGILRVGFLGPFGTFTEQALLTQPDLALAERVPFRNVPDVLDAVAAGEFDFGFVPIENSIEGTVNFTQDALAFDYDLLIQREVVLDIEHCLVAAAGTEVGDINVVLSIPVATAQCHQFLRSRLPHAAIEPASSTAEAARLLAEQPRAGCAAIAPRNAATLYGLSIVAENIADHGANQTRFVLVGRDAVPRRTGHDRTGLVVYQRADTPGSLIGILQEFAARRINLQNLLSRPTKRGGLGDYCFIVYAEGHISDELLADAMRSLHSTQGSVKFLGSYPVAGEQAHTAREHADARWTQADDWIDDLRQRII
jgi:prephenate dehydratase